MIRKNSLPLMALAVILAGPSCNQANCNQANVDTQENTNTTTNADVSGQEEWIPLFDGKTTNGWHSYGKQTAGSAWTVADSSLHLNAASEREGFQLQDGGDIVTEEEFDNFHLKLDWKVAENGNSGIIFYVKEDTAQYEHTWHTGLEMQVLDNEGHPDAKIHKHRAGDLYDLIASSEETVKPAGEWNHAEIISNQGQLELFLNGTKVVSTTLWDDNWKKMVSESKFKDMPGFGIHKSGKIALQDHGDNVWFKNIMIKRL